MRQNMSSTRGQFFVGENVTFSVTEAPLSGGVAVVRTNLGRGFYRQREIVARVEKNVPRTASDWHDVPMRSCGNGIYSVTLPLTEVGAFEAKCCFVYNDGNSILWADGANFQLKISAPSSASGNLIYCAFVRQFGKNCELDRSHPYASQINPLEKEGYAVLPPSGTFRQVIARLDHIFGTLGCKILQLLPIHPLPVSYGKMGVFGSPFAALDYFSVDSALADFDRNATPMEQFEELIDAVHAHGGRIFMDLPVNHTGWASKLQIEHPDYFVRNADGEFVSPGAWGVTWADLCQLDYKRLEVWRVMAKVFLFWAKRGVDGFRCDAGYMVPADAWEYITAKVRNEFPDVTFLLEGLGGPPKVQENLLANCGLDWGYSELFQNYDRTSIENYYPYMCHVGESCGTLVNFAETHDNDRLAATSRLYARLRFCVTALLSDGGSFGFANGAEFYADEKIDVHGAAALRYGAKDNCVELIGKLNRILNWHPAFAATAEKQLIEQGTGNVLALSRIASGGESLLVLCNLNCDAPEVAHWSNTATPSRGNDLLNGGQEIRFEEKNGEYMSQLQPGECRCVDFSGFEFPEEFELTRSQKQCADAMAKRAVLPLVGEERTVVATGAALLENPEKFMVDICGINPPPLSVWNVPEDARRIVPVPPRDVLLFKAKKLFAVKINDGKCCVARGRALPCAQGGYIVLLALPKNESGHDHMLNVEVRIHSSDGSKLISGKILQLTASENRKVDTRRTSNFDQLFAFAANYRGSYSLMQVRWGELRGKYEAVLAVNTGNGYPAERQVLFTRCRAWLVVNGYSCELNGNALYAFTGGNENRAKWEFLVPTGQGRRTPFNIEMEFSEVDDAVRLKFNHGQENATFEAENCLTAKLILRPDLECRINHELTRAYSGPEREFTAQTRTYGNGFDFTPYGRRLEVRVDRGKFHPEVEWQYMHNFSFECDYGLEDHTDLYSPGYFEIMLNSKESVTMTASTGGAFSFPIVKKQDFFTEAMRKFVVKRDEFATVMAGYPWFLDWGRDTLIALRGLVTSQEFQKKAASILRQFAIFEENGTIPNMIRGKDNGNRDTSDAPLYLIVATRDYCEAVKNRDILNSDCGNRTLRAVLESVVEHYIAGTPNGIKVDPASKLVFSPPHFTWMDTNYPAGTPREGYPIEIQALWYAALEFLGYDDLAKQVVKSVEKYFFTHDRCSDCLHCTADIPASAAVADDHVRCNQLFAVTLGVVQNKAKQLQILRDCADLLIPGGIRTLADKNVTYQLPIYHQGKLLNNPSNPYCGGYHGPEDTSRKVAYHNGTAWRWPFPAYCEALYLVGGEKCRKRALDLLWSAETGLVGSVVGQLSEVSDGDAPHRDGGCPAQAWSMTEFCRVKHLLSKDK